MPDPRSLIRAVRACILATPIALLAAACEGPTDPPNAVVFDLSGSWAGSVSVTFDEFDGGGLCTGAATAEFVQEGSTVTGSLVHPAGTGCMEDARLLLDGTLDGIDVRGDLRIGENVWQVQGSFYGQRLTLRAFNVSWDLRR